MKVIDQVFRSVEWNPSSFISTDNRDVSPNKNIYLILQMRHEGTNLLLWQVFGLLRFLKRSVT